jgi:hypothetical protein
MRMALIGGALALVLVPVGAWAQTPGTGAFTRLSLGEQKIARALFEAQSTSAGTPLTLDEIAAKKQGGQGWGEVFKQMKTRGLVTQKNLGQVVSSFERQHNEAAGATTRRGNSAGDTKAGAASSGRGGGHGGRR